jgi:hypothetical protein
LESPWKIQQSKGFTFSFGCSHGVQEKVVLYLDTTVKVTEASEKEKVTVKQIVSKCNVGKTQVYTILKAKSDKKPVTKL